VIKPPGKSRKRLICGTPFRKGRLKIAQSGFDGSDNVPSLAFITGQSAWHTLLDLVFEGIKLLPSCLEGGRVEFVRIQESSLP
jgi:hypothetical protein